MHGSATLTRFLTRTFDLAFTTRHACAIQVRRFNASTGMRGLTTGQVSVQRVSVAQKSAWKRRSRRQWRWGIRPSSIAFCAILAFPTIHCRGMVDRFVALQMCKPGKSLIAHTTFASCRRRSANIVVHLAVHCSVLCYSAMYYCSPLYGILNDQMLRLTHASESVSRGTSWVLHDPAKPRMK
jgi:hypothetical protein